MSIEAARTSAREVEGAVCAITPSLPRSPKKLRSEIHASLIRASDEGLLRSAPHDVFKLLNLTVEPMPQGEVAALICGEHFDDGQEEGAFLYRADGARLSFSITVHFPNTQAPVLFAYRFHVRFPAHSVPQFVRIDLNRPGGAIDPLAEPRSHLHPGSDDLRLPAPIMSPQQLVHTFLYDLTVG